MHRALETVFAIYRLQTGNAYFPNDSFYGTGAWSVEAWVYTLSWDNNGESALMMWGPR